MSSAAISFRPRTAGEDSPSTDARQRRPAVRAQVILGLASFLFQRDMDLLIIAPLSHMNSLIIQAYARPAPARAALRRSSLSKR